MVLTPFLSRIAFFTLVALSTCAAAGAQNTQGNKSQPEQDDSDIALLWNMPLADLLQVRVTVASGNPESITEAAGTVTSYAAQDINKLGLNTLAQLASLTPGYSTYSNIGEHTLETRGQKAGGFDNNRHLLLIDGIPANHIRAYTAQVDHNLPLHFADQVDFLRGPASALYGVSAFYGVISINPALSNRRSSQPATAVKVQASDNTGSIKFNRFINTDTAQGLISASHYQQQASLEPVASNPSQLNFDNQTSEFAFSKWQWDKGALTGLTAGAMYSSKKGGLGNFWADYSSDKNHITWKNFLAYAKYEKELSANLVSHSYIKYGYSSEDAEYYNATESERSAYSYPFHNYQAQTELHWHLEGAQHITAGINFDSRYGEAEDVDVAGVSRVTPKTPTVLTQSFYVQNKNEFDVLDGSLLTLGARLDNGSADSESYQQVSPRIAFVQKFNRWLSVKTLYAEALRGPSVKELGVNNEVRIEQPSVELQDLKPETIRSVELAPYIELNNWLMGLTFYSNKTSRYLARDWSQFGEYINIEQGFTSTGIELELNYAINKNVKLFANASSSKTEDNSGNAFLDVPRKKINLGWMWSMLGSAPINGAVTYTSVYDYANNLANTNADNSAASLVNVNIAYPMNRHMQVGLNVTNVFDDRAYWQLNGEANVQMPAREARLDLTFSF